MNFHGNDTQDRYKWYQSPHLGLSPAGFGGAISGGHYNHYPAYPLYSQSSFTQPNPYATVINGHWLPLQYPYGFQANTQSQPPSYVQPSYQQPFITTPQNPITNNPQNPSSCPTYHSSHSNPNPWIYPPISQSYSPPLTSYQQQPSSTLDVKQGEPDLHLGSNSRKPDRVLVLEGPNQNFGFASFTPEPMHGLKESGNPLSSTQGSGDLSDDKLCATRESSKKSMDTFMSEFKEELRLLRDSWKLQASHVDSALKKFESPPQSSTLEPEPATTEVSSLATLSSTAEPVSTAINAGLNLSPEMTLNLSDGNDAITVLGCNCEEGISIGMSDNLNQVINMMDASIESMETEIQVTEGVDNAKWKKKVHSHYIKHCTFDNGSSVEGSLLGSEAYTSTDIGKKLWDDNVDTKVVAAAVSKLSTDVILDLNSDISAVVVSGSNCEDDFSTDMFDGNKMGANSGSMESAHFNTLLPTVTINLIGNLQEVREFYEMESVNAKNNGMTLQYVQDDDDDPPDKEQSDEFDGSVNDIKQPVFYGGFQVSQSTGLSGDAVLNSDVHDLEASLESDICSNKSSLVSEDTDSKEAVKIINEHIMGCTRPPDDCQLDDHRYEQLSFVTVEKELFLEVEMVHKNIWEKGESIHVGLPSEGNGKELDSSVMEGLKLESEMKMCFVNKLFEAKFRQWLILCHWVTKKPAIFHREAFDKMGFPSDTLLSKGWLRLQVGVLLLHDLMEIKAKVLSGGTFLVIGLVFVNECLIVLTATIIVSLVSYLGEELQNTFLCTHLVSMSWLQRKDVLMETTYARAYLLVIFGYGLTLILQAINEDFHWVSSTIWGCLLFNRDVLYVVIGSTYWPLDYISGNIMIIADGTNLVFGVSFQSTRKEYKFDENRVQSFEGTISTWGDSSHRNEPTLFRVGRVKCVVTGLVFFLFLSGLVSNASWRTLVLPTYTIYVSLCDYVNSKATSEKHLAIASCVYQPELVSITPACMFEVDGMLEALRSTTNDEVCDFGAGPLFNIQPWLIQPTLEDQNRLLLVKVIDKLCHEVAELGSYVHSILMVILNLLIDEDYYAYMWGRNIISKLGMTSATIFSAEHLNLVAIVRIMENKQDVGNYLMTWIFIYWKCTHNGNHYKLHRDFQCHFYDYLLKLVETVLSNLESSKCVPKEGDNDLWPLNSDTRASYNCLSGSKTCELMLGGISTALRDNIFCYCDEIMIQLLKHLSSSQPPIFSCVDGPHLSMILYCWEIKAGQKSMECVPFEYPDYPTVELIYILLGLGSSLFVITSSLLMVADIASGATTQGHMLHVKVFDYSTYAYESLDVLLYELGDNTLADPHSIDSTNLGMLNTSAAAFDNSVASQLVNTILGCGLATSLGSCLLLGTLLISTLVCHMLMFWKSFARNLRTSFCGRGKKCNGSNLILGCVLCLGP